MSIHDKPGSAKRAVVITALDADLDDPIRGLYVAVGGDVKITTTGGDTVIIPAVPSGFIIPSEILRVWSAGTTASGFVGFFD